MIKKIIKGFIFGGHLLSLGAVGLTFGAAFILGIKTDVLFFVVVYLWTEAVYLYNRFKEINKDVVTDPQRTHYLKKNIKSLPYIIFFFFLLGVAILIYLNKIPALLFGLLLFLLSVLYSLFLKKFTRKVVAFKSFFVSLIWALMLVFLVLYYSFPFSWALLLLLIFVYLKLFIHEEFLNLTDVEGDNKERLQTLAIVLGEEKLLKLLNIINILSIIPLGLGVYFNLLPVYSLGLLLAIPYVFYYLKVLPQKQKNQEILSATLVDGEFVLWPIFLLLIKKVS